MKRPTSFALVVSLLVGLSVATEARSQTVIVSEKTGKCLDVPDGSKATHAIIQQSQCDGGPSQRWFFRNGTIVNQNSGLCLDIPSAYESDHTPLQQFPCHGGPNQLWTIGANGEIKSVATRKCLDIPDGLSDAHLFVQQFQCNGGLNQAWSIRPPATLDSDNTPHLETANAAADFLGSWTEKNPRNPAHPLRMVITQRGQQIVGLGFAFTVADGMATSSGDQGCAPQFKRAGYSYGAPPTYKAGTYLLTLKRQGANLIYTAGGYWTSACDGHEVGIDNTFQRELIRDDAK
jgi:hypothetical protein